jgi:hypothetical protein
MRHLAAALLLIWPASSAAQASIFSGQVVADSSFEPLDGAQVTLVELGRAARAAADGNFRFAELPAGTYTVSVRFLGYAPQDVRIAIGGRDSLVRDFLLKPARTVLPAVPVTAKAEPLHPTLSRFEEHRARGIGSFITGPELEKNEHRRLGDVLRTLPGATIGPLIIRRNLIPGAATIATRRGNGSIRAGNVPCYAAVYLDNIRIFDPRNGQDPIDINQFAVTNLEGIEYYAGASETPVELNMTGSACGVLVLWTRTKR